MSRILTVTMNPAIDVSTSVERVAPEVKLRCSEPRRDPGGGGINVARVTSRLGAETTALYPAGGHVGQLLQQLVARENVRSIAIPIGGETREDFTVLDTVTREQYRFVLAGPTLSETEWRRCLETIEAQARNADSIVLSGSLPPGVPEDFYARIAAIAKDRAFVALDTSGPALRAGITGGVDLLKPHLRELRQLTGTSLPDEPSWFDAAEHLVATGRAKIVALSLGHLGALLVGASVRWRARPIEITPESTVGAGDSFLGAMVWALASGRPLEEAFRYGVAGGSAALLAPGTELCQASDVHRLFAGVVVELVD